MSQKQFSISVVIPNYNGIKLLEANLPPLFTALDISGSDYEIILSDDFSNDGSIQFVKNTYPFIICIESLTNTGFSATVNRGIEKASKDLVMILNSDVVLFPDYFLPCFKYFSKENTFGVMGRIIDLETDHIQDGGKFPAGDYLKINSTINYYPNGKELSNDWWPSLFLSGANALVSRSKIELLGGFDTIFSPFYVEDVDLSIRAWRLGWNCYYEHRAICRHPASTTIKSYHKREFIQSISVRNRAFLHHLHLSEKHLIFWQLTLALKWMMALLLFKKSTLRGIGMYFKASDKVKKSKKNFENLAESLGVKLQDLMQIKDYLRNELNGRSIHKF